VRETATGIAMAVAHWGAAVIVILVLAQVSEAFKDRRASGTCVYYAGDRDCLSLEEFNALQKQKAEDFRGVK
jgi:hypothetical protein